MPPKTAAPESSHDMVVNTLCEMLIMGEFKIDNTAFAPIVGLKDGKNVLVIIIPPGVYCY